jgi:hypothetical protein
MLAAVVLLAVGLSHILQARAWAQLFIQLRDRGEAGALVNGGMTLVTGAVVVSFHNVWNGLPVVLTIIGWLWVVKGTLCLLQPKLGIRSMSLVSLETANRFAIPGIGLVLLAGVLAFDLLRS